MRLPSKLIVLVGLCAFGTPPTVTLLSQQASRAEDPAILRIRARFTRIEREASTYRCRSIDLEGFSTEGGSVEACYAGRELRRLSASYLGQTGRGSEKFYFWRLAQVAVRDGLALRPALSGRVVKTEDERLYWDGGGLIRWVKGTTRQAVDGADATDRSSEARETARKLAECAGKTEEGVCEAQESRWARRLQPPARLVGVADAAIRCSARSGFANVARQSYESRGECCCHAFTARRHHSRWVQLVQSQHDHEGIANSEDDMSPRVDQ